jgi:hypothetical protein
MHYCVVLTLSNPGQCLVMMEAWEAAGAPGGTILDTNIRADKGSRGPVYDDIALLPKMRDLLSSEEEQQRTLFSVVKGESQVQALIEASRRAINECDEAQAGSIFVLPVSRVYGWKKN